MMDLQQRLTLLTGIDLFAGLRGSELLPLAEAVQEVELPADSTLYTEGEPGQDMFLLLEGSLRIFKDKRLITTLAPIDYIGEMALIEDKPRSATVVSASPVRLLRLTSSQFQEFLLTQPQALLHLTQALSRRIRRDTEQLAQEYQKANILIHDMRNSMTAFTLLDLMADEPLSADGRAFMGLMQKARQDVNAMMAEALANAKRLQFPKERQLGSLPALLGDLTATLRCHPDLTDKPILVDQCTEIPELPFNRLDIGRALANLLINAGQASPSGSPVTIRLAAETDGVTVEVSDQGTGIPEDIQGSIFLPQFTTKADGNGLGLASCKEIIEHRHGGTVSVHSCPGQGSTFRFTLPLAPPA